MLGFQLDIKKKYELWSLVGPEPVRFSLLEFEHLTGLNCEYIEDLERPHSVVTKELTSFWEMLGVHVEAGPSTQEIIAALERCEGWSRDDRKRLAYLAIFTGYIEGRKYSTPTRVSLARLVMELERFENYPWGRVAFKVLMDSVKGRDISGCYTINGFAQAFQVWVYTALPELGATFGNPLPNNPSPPILAYKGRKGRTHISPEELDVIMEPFLYMVPYLLVECVSSDELRAQYSLELFTYERPTNIPPARAGDCGVYTLKYIECHALGIEFSKKDFAKANGKSMRDKMAVDIFQELPDAHEFENKDMDDILEDLQLSRLDDLTISSLESLLSSDLLSSGRLNTGRLTGRPSGRVSRLHIDAWINVLRKRYDTNPQHFRSERMCFLDHLFAQQWRFNFKDFKDSMPDQIDLGRRLPGGAWNYYAGTIPSFCQSNKVWGTDIDDIYAPYLPRRLDVVMEPFLYMVSYLLVECASSDELRAQYSLEPFTYGRPTNIPPARAGDCGVYTLKYIECHALGIEFSKNDFAKPNGKSMRDKMAVDIF
ncbi:hypothetical protein F2Q70_00020784 [Brassica cretica]|uniref:Ubiquitin-like protease family profile domain-containing protein n=1 Tax=Brassica cretica TaxID=69181 RepID=A0A8S9GHV5_BRACR|nr:hypothetical protein F2Q70_00020784 [Brassica cretica]